MPLPKKYLKIEGRRGELEEEGGEETWMVETVYVLQIQLMLQLI